MSNPNSLDLSSFASGSSLIHNKITSVPLRQAPSSPAQSNAATHARRGGGRRVRDGFLGKRVHREPLRWGQEKVADCQLKPGAEALDEVRFEG